MRLISLVPSKIRLMRESRYARQTGYSSWKPYPPKICTASSTTKSSISLPYTLAIELSIAYSSSTFIVF